ncbi:MAG: hypothetical protein ACYC1Q_00245 [Bacteroidia bacterium]
MELIIDKPKTWKGLSYVLKSSLLEKVIKDRGLECYVQLHYWTPQGNNKTNCRLIEAEYWDTNENVPYSRFYIRTGVVPSAERKKVEELLMSEVLPKLIVWMERKVNEPINSTQRSGMFCAYYNEGILAVS